MNWYSWYAKWILVLLVVNTMAFVEGFCLASLGSGLVTVGLTITSVLAVMAMSRFGLLNTTSGGKNAIVGVEHRH